MSSADAVVVGGSRLLVQWPVVSAEEESSCVSSIPRGGWERWVNRPKRLGAGAHVAAVLLLHGRLGKKEQMDKIAKQLAADGRVVIYGDLCNHGERLLDRERNLSWSEENWTHAVDMYSQMWQGVKEIQVQMELLPAVLDVCFDRVAVVGISQGGHTALLAAANEPRIDVCVAMIGSGDYELNMTTRYERLLREYVDKNKGAPPPFAELFPTALKGLVERVDPIHNPVRLAAQNRPILMINGGDDTLVPLECNLQLMKLVKPLYTGDNAARLRLDVLPGVGHKTPPEMIEKVFEFLSLHLGSSSRISASL